MQANQIELSVESFFNRSLVGRDDVERLMVALFEHRGSLEVCLDGDAVRITLQPFEPTLVIRGNLRDEFKYMSGLELRGLFVPALLDIECLMIPHISFTKVLCHSTLGNFILESVYSHLLRGLGARIEDVSEVPSIINLQYFYYLRWLFPLSFGERVGEYDCMLSSLASGLSYWEDPILTFQAGLIKSPGLDQEMAFRELVTDRLLAMRNRLLEVI